MVKNPTTIKEILLRQSSMAISRQVFAASLLDISAVNFHRAVVNESEMIKTQRGSIIYQ
jgi:hypothetical protein